VESSWFLSFGYWNRHSNCESHCKLLRAIRGTALFFEDNQGTSGGISSKEMVSVDRSHNAKKKNQNTRMK